MKKGLFGLMLFFTGYLHAAHVGSQLLSINLGVGIPAANLDLKGVGGGEDRIGSTGFSGGLQYISLITPSVGLGAEVNYTAMGDKKSTKLVADADSTTNSKSSVLLGLVRFNTGDHNNLSTFFLVGLGIHNTSLKFESTPAPGFAWTDTSTTETRSFVDDSGMGFAAALGTGVDISLSDEVFIGAEARYQYLSEVTYDASSAGKAVGIAEVKGPASMINLFVRIGRVF